MKLVIFGLSVSSAWGNGHATLWRGLCGALADAGHEIVFFEKDVPYYASHRDLRRSANAWVLHLYKDWTGAIAVAKHELKDADVGMVTSFCPDGVAATRLLMDSALPLRCFYDLDTPVTLQRLRRGEPLEYIGEGGLAGFDLVLSYTGGAALDALTNELGARRVATLYGSVDPRAHQPIPARSRQCMDGFAASYLGTYAPDRQAALEALFFEPARRLGDRRFVLGGALYPIDLDWPDNVDYLAHVPPCEHSSFYAAAPLTINVTREAMAAFGYCPSARLFEAAACGVPVLSDAWEGLDQFFEPGREILLARTSDEAVAAISRPPEQLARIGEAARERALAEHSAAARAQELIAKLEGAGAR